MVSGFDGRGDGASAAVPFLDSPPSVVYVESLNEGTTAIQCLLLCYVLVLFGGSGGFVCLVAVETLETRSKGSFPIESHCPGICSPI